MKKKLTILNTPQFGTLIDSLKWCEHLSKKYDITFVCFYNHLKRMDIEGVNYKYVHRFDNPTLRGVWYIIYALFYCLCHSDPVFIVYFKHCDLLPRLLPFRRFHVDIRTLAVTKDVAVNERADNLLRKSLSYFNSASFISNGVKEKIAPKINQTSILPLGSDVIDFSSKRWNEIRLLYVGTLQHRDIPKTIEGLYDYITKHGKEGISYDIVGDGPELQQIKNICEERNMLDIVHLHGKLPYDELKPFFAKCNIGVSFIPIEDCYQYQPPTKTFEYILSGLYCIGTKTHANKEVIIPTNGVLINDNKEAFCKALEYIKQNSKSFDSKVIQETLIDKFSWSTIVNKKLIPIIESI